MRNKKKIIIMTLFSALLFCLVIVMSSLSPLADTGKNANQFNSIGMWLSIAMMVVLYFVPLLLYAIGLEWMKYVMAVFCSLSLLSLLPMIGIVVFLGVMEGFTSSLIGVVIVCGMNILINTIWFLTAFSKGSKTPIGGSLKNPIQN